VRRSGRNSPVLRPCRERRFPRVLAILSSAGFPPSTRRREFVAGKFGCRDRDDHCWSHRSVRARLRIRLPPRMSGVEALHIRTTRVLAPEIVEGWLAKRDSTFGSLKRPWRVLTFPYQLLSCLFATPTMMKLLPILRLEARRHPAPAPYPFL
jgi:hypothetical protein